MSCTGAGTCRRGRRPRRRWQTRLCSRLDARLAGLAEAAGGRYTRYADDLAFSGDGEFARGVLRFAAHVGAVALEEGFRVNHRKTRVMRQGVRQALTGLVVNRKLGAGRGRSSMR